MSPLRILVAMTGLALSHADGNHSASSAVYDESLAINLALYSSAAYCNPNKVASWSLTPFCAANLSTFEIKNTYEVNGAGTFKQNAGYAYIGVDSGREMIVASFKGSNNTYDWALDIFGLEFDFRSCTLTSGTTAGTVHAGFCRYYVDLAHLGISTDFVALAKEYPTYTPVITGHSLGATAAALLAYDVHDLSGGDVAATLYTFGSPRVGSYDFAQALGDRAAVHFRLTHWKDIVPHIPLPCRGLNKSRACPYHAATEVFYTEDSSRYKVCDGSGEDSTCSNKFLLPDSFDDHCSYFESTIGSICGTCCHD